MGEPAVYTDPGPGPVDSEVDARRAGLPIARLALIGFGVTLVGLWGGAVAYFGPEIGFAPSGASAWQWTWTNTALALMPGAVAVAGGLIMLVGSRFGLAAHRIGGLMAAVAGAWFVFGPYAWPVLYGTPYAPYQPGTGTGALMRLAMIAGYGAGVGVALCALGGMAMAIGAGIRRAVPPAMARERRTPAVTTLHEPVRA